MEGLGYLPHPPQSLRSPNIEIPFLMFIEVGISIVF